MGLHFIHQQGDEHLAGVDETLGPGACAFDYDNDGWMDLFLVNGSGHTRYYGKSHWWQTSQGNALFRNVGGKRFVDVTEASGLAVQMWGMGCVTGDFDNDGDPDLLVTGRDASFFYKNNGDGTFQDITEDSGIDGRYWSTSAAVADFNGDGLLDLYIGNYIDFKKGARTFEADSQFAPVKRVTFNPALYEPQPNQLYLNLGNLKFKDVTQDAGVADADGRTLDVAWQDINGDRRPDLIVTNDRGTGSNVAFLNQDGQHFKPSGIEFRLQSALGSRGIAAGDVGNDGNLDLAIASAPGANTVLLVAGDHSIQGLTADRYRYTDRAREIGIGDSQFRHLSGWTPGLHDFNNDGWQDLFLAAGQLEPDSDTPRVTGGQPKQILINLGHGKFIDTTDLSGIALRDNQSARGAVFADFDNDGDIDVYVAHNNDLGQFLRNESPVRHWLGLRLVGKNSNRDAIGAQVRLTLATGTQFRTVTSGEGFLSDGDKRLLFGLGDDETVERLNILWPDGSKQDFDQIPIDRYLLIEQGRREITELSAQSAGEATNGGLRLKQGANQPQIRIRYLKLITDLDGISAALPEIASASRDADPNVRRTAIELLTRNKTPEGLETLVRALDDPEPANVSAAIEALRLYEDETAVRWLLRLFSHSEPLVKVALARCFEFFFQEEEAVVHRKYLAVPHLIRLLDDPAPEVRAAAARALASAERYRGLHSLVDHLGDPDPTTRGEIVRTLGLIRQRHAVPDLRRLLTDTNQPANVVANAFIALKRLDEQAISEVLKNMVLGEGHYSNVPAVKRLDILAELLKQTEESTAFDKASLKAVSDTAFAVFGKTGRPRSGMAPDLLRWIHIRQHFIDDETLAWLDRLSRNESTEIRAAAYEALLTIKEIDRASIVHRALADKEEAVRQLAATRVAGSGIRLSVGDYRTAFGDRTLRSPFIKNWLEAGTPGASELLPLLASQPSLSPANANEPTGERGQISNANFRPRKASLSAVDARAKTPQPERPQNAKSELGILERACRDEDVLVQDACLAVLFSQKSPEHCEMAAALLTDKGGNIRLRGELLKRYGAEFDSDAINTLFALARGKKDPLRNAAVHKLLEFDSDALLDFSWKLANDVSEDSEIRFSAVEFLLRRGQKNAREVLYR